MNIPIFVPHEGCPNDCAFCNQRSITGSAKAPSIEEARAVIEDYLSGGKRENNTIAFFGGSFTGIDFQKQREYLALAKEYVDMGAVSGIRLSTRPDYIDDERLALLKEYGVTNVELGAQSMDNEVLIRANRGHNSEAVYRASELIKNAGITLGLQMMTGLPLDTPEKSIKTARDFVRIGAEETRIYPTLVMKNTALAYMLTCGEYTPQSVEEAVELGAMLYEIFTENNVKVLRIGLSDSAELKENCIGGPYHPAMGELVKGRYIRRLLENLDEGNRLEVLAPKKYFSKIVGNKRCNALYFEEKGIELKLVPCDGEIKVNGKKCPKMEAV